MRKQIGTAGHFIGCRQCCFHLHTELDGPNGYMVSTVGCWHPDGEGTVPSKIGRGRLYETMVFKLENGAPCSMREVEMMPANSAEHAQACHEAMCARYEARPELAFRPETIVADTHRGTYYVHTYHSDGELRAWATLHNYGGDCELVDTPPLGCGVDECLRACERHAEAQPAYPELLAWPACGEVTP